MRVSKDTAIKNESISKERKSENIKDIYVKN